MTDFDKSEQPLVSVLIPSFNAEKWLSGAIESALKQTYPNIEVLVIDDGSSDGSVEIALQFGDLIRFRSRENRGGNQTRNELLAECSGLWVQFLDADDYLEPDKIRVQMDALGKFGDGELVDVLYSPVKVKNYAGNECVSTKEPQSPDSQDPWVLHARWELTQTGGALFRKSSLEDVGGWNEDQKCCQDNELFMRLLMGEKNFRACPGAVAVYRRFEDGTVSTGRRSRVTLETLRLLDLTEAHLREHGMLDQARMQAINFQRFRMARTLWPSDRNRSREIIKQIKSIQPGFVPDLGPAAPRGYLKLFSIVGFSLTERIAEFKRKVFGR